MDAALAAGIQAAWRDGYDCAVQTLREMADAVPDPALAEAFRQAAELLDSASPWGKE